MKAGGGRSGAVPGDVLTSRTLQRRYQPEKGTSAKADKWYNVSQNKLIHSITINDQEGHSWKEKKKKNRNENKAPELWLFNSYLIRTFFG